MKCWNCGAELKELEFGKVSFRATCDVCHAALHCCANCVYYKPGLPNDCAVPGTDFIADRQATNFCEEFKILGKPPAPKKSADDVSKRLFGEDSSDLKKKDPKKRFNSLFDDINPI
jgi:hypothetical protein